MQFIFKWKEEKYNKCLKNFCIIKNIWDRKTETHIEQFYAYGKENIKITELFRDITTSPIDNNTNNSPRHNETRHKLTRE
jgi:hypothetical protein